jgi:hypothetical protein
MVLAFWSLSFVTAPRIGMMMVMMMDEWMGDWTLD